VRGIVGEEDRRKEQLKRKKKIKEKETKRKKGLGGEE